MYKTFEDLYNNTINDALADLILSVEDEAEWYGEEIYALCISFLKYGEHILQNKKIREYDRWYITTNLSKALREMLIQDVQDVVNNIMHIMHEHNNDLRKEGTIEYHRALEQSITGKKSVMTVSPSYEGIILTGKSPVPEKWIQEIEDVAAQNSCYVNISMSWLYSHLDCGSGYGYNIPEFIEVDIFGDSEELITKAADKIKRLHFKWET